MGYDSFLGGVVRDSGRTARHSDFLDLAWSFMEQAKFSHIFLFVQGCLLNWKQATRASGYLSIGHFLSLGFVLTLLWDNGRLIEKVSAEQ